MTKEKIVKFATFGPNRGLTLKIGNYQFVDGECSMPEQDASGAARILCRYHDVCYEHELKDKVKEYDAKYGKPESVGDDPVINQANEEVAKRNSPKKPAAEKAAEKTEPPSEETPENKENPEGGESDKETSAKAEKKKGN